MALTKNETISILTAQRLVLMQELLNIQGYRFNSTTERRWERIEKKINAIDKRLIGLKRQK